MYLNVILYRYSNYKAFIAIFTKQLIALNIYNIDYYMHLLFVFKLAIYAVDCAERYITWYIQPLWG